MFETENDIIGYEFSGLFRLALVTCNETVVCVDWSEDRECEKFK